MVKKIKAIPEGYHSVTVNLVVKNGAQAIEFYKKAFEAKELYSMNSPGGKLIHAELKIGDSFTMLGEECGPHPGHEENCPKSPATLRGTSFTIFLYVEDVDKVFGQAILAGARKVMAVENMFWGDRVGTVIDPSGHSWMIATHVEEVSPEEMKKRGEKFVKEMP
jgi:PhnB protein